MSGEIVKRTELPFAYPLQEIVRGVFISRNDPLEEQERKRQLNFYRDGNYGSDTKSIEEQIRRVAGFGNLKSEMSNFRYFKEVLQLVAAGSAVLQEVGFNEEDVRGLLGGHAEQAIRSHEDYISLRNGKSVSEVEKDSISHREIEIEGLRSFREKLLQRVGSSVKPIDKIAVQ